MFGCKEFEGRIEVSETLTPIVKKGNKTIAPGSYDVKVTFPDKKKARIEVKIEGKNNNPQIDLKLPSGKSFPEYDGPITLSSQESGQPYDVNGNLRSDIQRTQTVRDEETCTYYVRERECNTDKNGNRVCKDRDVAHTGDRPVEYYYEELTQYLDLSLERPNSNVEVAHLGGTYFNRDKIYTYQGPCYERFGWGGHHNDQNEWPFGGIHLGN
jgi:hypothetical protein